MLGEMSTEMPPESESPLRSALAPDALRAALRFRRPVFRDPWDSPGDMFGSYLAISIVGPLLLFCGAEAMGWIFGLDSRWPLGLFMAANVVGAAGFITIVGRHRTSLSVDVLAIGAWLAVGLVVAPLVGLVLPAVVALACDALLLVGIFAGVRHFGEWEIDIRRTLSWPATWSVLGLLFAYSWHALVFYP